MSNKSFYVPDVIKNEDISTSGGVVSGVLAHKGIVPGSVYVEVFTSETAVIPFLSVSFNDDGLPDVILFGKQHASLVVDTGQGASFFDIITGKVQVSLRGSVFPDGCASYVNYEL